MTDSFSEYVDGEAGKQNGGATQNENRAQSNATASPRRRNTPDHVRLPPNSPESEQGIIGCILQSPQDCLGECMEKLGDGGVVFYDLRNLTIYDACVGMHDRREPIDIITLQQKLKDDDMLEQVGGIPYLNQCVDAVPSAANLITYLDIIQEKYLFRKMIQTCTAAVGRVYEYQGEVDALMDEIERDVLAIRPGKRLGEADAKTLVNHALTELERLFAQAGAIGGLSTGLPDVDKLTDGLHAGEMIVVAAYPGVGKSALSANIAVINALAGHACAIFSLEMTPGQLMMRALCSEARLDTYAVRDNTVSEADMARLNIAAQRLRAAPIRIENCNGMTSGQLRAMARRLHQKEPLRLAVVDYLQLVSHPADNREQEVAAISKAVKSMAMELNIPVLALSQLNDEGRMRESRAIGQDADSVWKIELDGERQPKDQPVKLRVDKNRNGPTGTVNLMFRKTFTRFESRSKIQDADIPPPNYDYNK